MKEGKTLCWSRHHKYCSFISFKFLTVMRGSRFDSRFVPPSLFSGHPTLRSLSALIWSIVLVIWGDQLSLLHRPHRPDAEDLHLQRAWMNTCCDLLSHTNAAQSSPSVWIWKKKKGSECRNSFRMWFKSVTTTALWSAEAVTGIGPHLWKEKIWFSNEQLSYTGLSNQLNSPGYIIIYRNGS